MSLNFLKWQQGTADFKQNLGLVLLLFIISLFIIFKNTGREGKRLAISGGVLALLVFVPLTAVLLMMGYTGFYDWDDLQLLIPFTPVLALGGCLTVEKLSGARTPAVEAESETAGPEPAATAAAKTAPDETGIRRLPVAAAACMIFLLLAATDFHAFDSQEESDGYGIPAWTLEVYESLQENVGDKELTILADSELLQYVRLYNADWYPAYGRDLWDSHAAGYVEYAYDAGTEEIYEILGSSLMTKENAAVIVSYVEAAQPDCLIVSKDWETALLGKLSDYNLITLTEQYIGYVKMDN